MRSDFIFPPAEFITAQSDTDLEHLIDFIDRKGLEEYIKKQQEEIKKDSCWLLGREMFKNDDDTPWEMTPAQLCLFKAITLRQYPRMQIITPTQYGKTQGIANGVLTRIAIYPDDYALLVPDVKRGKITINYIINAVAKNDFFASKLIGVNVKERTKLDRLLEEKSKTRLTFQIIDGDNVKYSSITLISTDARRKTDATNAIMGFGGRNIIADESALTSDEIEAAVFRMLAGKGVDTFYLKIGNPFKRNHFMESWKDSKYKKIYVDFLIGMLEGRYTEEFISEARTKPMFDVFYKCKFPLQNEVDDGGWSVLLTDTEIESAMQEVPHFGEEKIGTDPAGDGGDNAAIIKRSDGFAEIVYNNEKSDAMFISGQTIIAVDDTNSKKAYIDMVGVGYGVLSRLNEVNRTSKGNSLKITGVNAGEKASDSTKFFNKRAEMFWRLRDWIKAGGRLSSDSAWYQLSNVKWTTNSTGKIQIMSKEEMRKRGIPSPNVADALSLTFYDVGFGNMARRREELEFRKMLAEEKKKHKEGNGGEGYNLRMTRG